MEHLFWHEDHIHIPIAAGWDIVKVPTMDVYTNILEGETPEDAANNALQGLKDAWLEAQE